MEWDFSRPTSIGWVNRFQLQIWVRGDITRVCRYFVHKCQRVIDLNGVEDMMTVSLWICKSPCVINDSCGFVMTSRNFWSQSSVLEAQRSTHRKIQRDYLKAYISYSFHNPLWTFITECGNKIRSSNSTNGRTFPNLLILIHKAICNKSAAHHDKKTTNDNFIGSSILFVRKLTTNLVVNWRNWQTLNHVLCLSFTFYYSSSCNNFLSFFLIVGS